MRKSQISNRSFEPDPLDYEAVAHHTNMDVADRVQPEDLKQAAAVLARMLFQASNAPEMMPRMARP